MKLRADWRIGPRPSRLYMIRLQCLNPVSFAACGQKLWGTKPGFSISFSTQAGVLTGVLTHTVG